MGFTYDVQWVVALWVVVVAVLVLLVLGVGVFFALWDRRRGFAAIAVLVVMGVGIAGSIWYASQPLAARDLLHDEASVVGGTDRVEELLAEGWRAEDVRLYGRVGKLGSLGAGVGDALVAGDVVQVEWKRGGNEELCDVVPAAPVSGDGKQEVAVYCGGRLVKPAG